MSVNPVTPVDPDEWFVSTFRALKSYILAYSDPDIYDVLENWPGTDLLAKRLPLDKTLIHFELDNPQHRPLGFGDNVVDYEYDDVAGTVVLTEAQWHTLNFDLGIWASERSGGVTSRLEAFQFLSNIFVGVLSFEDIRDKTNIEVLSFGGGTFTEETINEIPVWRVADMTLIVRVFSRKKPIPIPYVDGSGVIIVPDYVDVQNTTINDT